MSKCPKYASRRRELGRGVGGEEEGKEKKEIKSSQNRTDFGIYHFHSCSRGINMLREFSQFSILPACRESCTSESLVLFNIRKHVQGFQPLIYTIKIQFNLSFPTQIWDRNQVANTRSVGTQIH